MTSNGWWLFGTGLCTLILMLTNLVVRAELGRHRIDPIGKRWGGLDNTIDGAIASLRTESYRESGLKLLPLYRALVVLLLLSFVFFMSIAFGFASR